MRNQLNSVPAAQSYEIASSDNSLFLFLFVFCVAQHVGVDARHRCRSH